MEVAPLKKVRRVGIIRAYLVLMIELRCGISFSPRRRHTERKLGRRAEAWLSPGVPGQRRRLFLRGNRTFNRCAAANSPRPYRKSAAAHYSIPL